VPFAAERRDRAADAGRAADGARAAELVRESELSPTSLAAAIERAAGREPATVAIDIDGAANSARLILALIEGHTPGISPRDLAAKTGTAMIHR